MTWEIRCVYESQDGLGEAPLWVEEEQALYWTDHVGCRLTRWSPESGTAKVWETPGPVGSFALRQRGGMVGASDAGFLAIDLDEGQFRAVVDPEADRPENRFNDGKCDRQGRFWCGSMNKALAEPSGRIYCLDPDWSVRAEAADFAFKCSNGTAFSLDGRTMYFADTQGQVIYRFDLDPDSGHLSNQRPYLSTAERPGLVDGGTVDAEGYYWCAMVGGSQVLRIDPKGAVVLAIDMPVPRPSCVTFGGANHDVLYVTSQRIFMTDEQLAAYPQSGNLFAIEGLGVRGLPEPCFAG